MYAYTYLRLRCCIHTFPVSPRRRPNPLKKCPTYANERLLTYVIPMLSGSARRAGLRAALLNVLTSCGCVDVVPTLAV